MKRAADLAIILMLLGMVSRIQPLQAQHGSQGVMPTSFSPQALTDAGTSRFAGPWQEVRAKSFLAGNQALSGQVSAIAVDLVNDPTGNTVYVGSSSGGVWKSSNGLSASPRFALISDQKQSLSVGAIALDTRTNPPRIYVGTGAPDNSANISSYTGTGILSSTDGGATWTRVDGADGGTHTFVGLGFSSILIDPQNPDIMLAATGMANDPNHPHNSVPQGDDPAFNSLGIYRSTDAGKTWKQVMSANYSTQSPNGCWPTPDILFPLGFFHIELLYEPTQKLYYAGVSSVGLFVSKDQGVSWQSFASLGLGTGLPAGNKMFKTSLASRNGELFAFMMTDPCAADGFMLSHSVNGGTSWLTMQHPVGGLFKGNLMYVAAPPGSSLVLLATDSLFSWNTLSFHPAWTNIQHNIHVDQHAIAYAAPGTWYVGNDGGAWVTKDSGNTWTSLNADLHAAEVFSADENLDGVFAAGLNDNGNFLAAPMKDWIQVTGDDGMYLSADPGAASAFFLSTHSGNIIYLKVANPPQSASIANFGVPGIGADIIMPFEVLNADARSPVRLGATGSGQTIVRNGRILLAGATNPYLLALDTSTLLNPCQLRNSTCKLSLPSNPQVVKLSKSINQPIHYLAPVPDDATKAYIVAGSSLFLLTNISFAGNATVAPIATGPVNGDVLGHVAADSGWKHSLSH